MKLYDVGETIEEGLPISVLEEERRAYLNVGRDPEDTSLCSILPFGKELSEHLLSETNPLSVKKCPDVAMFQGSIAREDGELCLIHPFRPDRSALVRVALVHGVGGKIEYFFGEGVDVIAEGVLGVHPEVFPVYVLAMPEGSSFHVSRTGDIDGLPAELSFTWTGEKIRQEPA